jgi:hypothetical protein
MDLLSRMESWRAEPILDSSRAFERFPVRGDATLERAQAPHAHVQLRHVMLRDLSRGGVGFLCDEQIEPGTVWRISFYDRGQKVGTQALIVRFCRLVQDGLYLAGGQFVIEPYLMLVLGITEHDLAHDIQARARPEDTADFVAPDQVDPSPA